MNPQEEKPTAFFISPSNVGLNWEILMSNFWDVTSIYDGQEVVYPWCNWLMRLESTHIVRRYGPGEETMRG